MTYKQAFDKITTAYIDGKLKPWSNCACFIGNIFSGNFEWAGACRGKSSVVPDIYFNNKAKKAGRQFIKEWGDGIYTVRDIIKLENNFLTIIKQSPEDILGNPIYEKDYEDKLFLAMETTLEMLKKIHERSGEIVDAPVFTKRNLQTA